MSKKYDKFLRNEQWLNQKYWIERLTQQRIADIVGCDRRSVSYAFKRFNILCRSLSEAGKGRAGWNKGKHHSKETILKMSESLRGEKNPFYGKHHSKATKKKMSEAKIKEKNPNYGKPFTKERKDKMSKNGRGKQHKNRGDKHWNWKGGISSERKRLWTSTEYREWRRQVFERDDYTCQVCEKRGLVLCAHHIKPFATYPELRFDINNGITLCGACHLSVLGKEDIYAQHFISLLNVQI